MKPTFGQPEHPARGVAKVYVGPRSGLVIQDPPLGGEWKPAPVEVLQLVLTRLRELD